MIITTALIDPGRYESTIVPMSLGEVQRVELQDALRHNNAQTEFVPVPVGLPLSKGVQAEHMAAGGHAVVEDGFKSLCLNISLAYLKPAILA